MIPKSTYHRRLKKAQALNLRAPILASNSPEYPNDSSIDDDLDCKDNHDSIDSGSSRDGRASGPEGEDDHDSLDSGNSRDGRASEPAEVSPDESTTRNSASDRDCIRTIGGKFSIFRGGRGLKPDRARELPGTGNYREQFSVYICTLQDGNGCTQVTHPRVCDVGVEMKPPMSSRQSKDCLLPGLRKCATLA